MLDSKLQGNTSYSADCLIRARLTNPLELRGASSSQHPKSALTRYSQNPHFPSWVHLQEEHSPRREAVEPRAFSNSFRAWIGNTGALSLCINACEPSFPYLINQSKTWPCSAENTAGLSPIAPVGPMWLVLGCLLPGVVTDTLVATALYKNIDEQGPRLSDATSKHHKKTQEANRTNYCLLVKVRKKKDFSGTWKHPGVAFPSQTYVSFSPMHQGTVEKQGRPCSGSLHTGKVLERYLCLPARESTTQWPGEKRPPLAPCSEITWKEDSGEFSIFPFSSLSKWMFPLEKPSALPIFKTAQGLQPTYKLQKSAAGQDGNIFSSINPSS